MDELKQTYPRENQNCYKIINKTLVNSLIGVCIRPIYGFRKGCCYFEIALWDRNHKMNLKFIVIHVFQQQQKRQSFNLQRKISNIEHHVVTVFIALF